jgi:hypothetical protein
VRCKPENGGVSIFAVPLSPNLPRQHIGRIASDTSPVADDVIGATGLSTYHRASGTALGHRKGNRMNVAQLIDLLRQCKPDSRAAVDGYEAGFDDITGIHAQTILVNANQVPRPWRWPKARPENDMEVPTTFDAGAHAADDFDTPDKVREQSFREEAIYMSRMKRSEQN